MDQTQIDEVVSRLASYRGPGATKWSIQPWPKGWSVALVCDECELSYQALLPPEPTYGDAMESLVSVLDRSREFPEIKYVADLSVLLHILAKAVEVVTGGGCED